MFHLPKDTLLGHLRIENIFQFYDIPRLFTCSNRSNTKFLATSILDDYETFNWLYLPISTDRLSTLIKKGMLLKQAFCDPEDGYLYSVESDFFGKSKIERILAEQINDEDLPDEDVYLEGECSTPIGFGEIDVERAAKSSRRNTCNIHLNMESTKRSEIDAKHLGSITTSFQEVFDAVGQFCKGDHTLKGPIPAGILEETNLKVTQTFQGSFGIQLKSNPTDILGYSLASEVFEELTNLIELKDNKDNISNKLHQLKSRVTSKYRNFLRDLSKLSSPMELHWGSPDPKKKSVVVSLTQQEIQKAFDVINKIEIEISESVKFMAELLGLDVKTKHFRVRNLMDNKDYKGKIADDSLSQVTHSEISGRYEVVLKKIIETTSSSGSEHIKWMLVELKAAQE